ncbi:uncharacterized protein LOC119399802 isoform X2 [Rhipicephalus sanguineus]|uniref:uncharacterized protein LOC119399802 isoform X2 n=1 Tax=Rhipicephalus sanguineus TaxID=34632 RepID=UPI0018959F19|nr:uncharacterized protein LOC119399802 isoform X2 [Rhipicephalus sanguineus]
MWQNPSAVEDTPAETPATTDSDSNSPDGWNFVKNGTRYDMLERNFYPNGFNESVECLSSLLTNKNESSHRLDGFIKYQNISTKTWVTVNQTYQFSQDNTTNYNVMNATEDSQGPHGSQHFIVNGTSCAGVTVVYGSQKRQASQEALPEARTDGSQVATVQCILWLEHGTNESEAEPCRKVLQDRCGGTFHTTYNKTSCPPEDN